METIGEVSALLATEGDPPHIGSPEPTTRTSTGEKTLPNHWRGYMKSLHWWWWVFGDYRGRSARANFLNSILSKLSGTMNNFCI